MNNHTDVLIIHTAICAGATQMAFMAEEKSPTRISLRLVATNCSRMGIKMNKYIDNINVYLKERHIKNNYLIMQTGWDKSKVSRILNGEKDITFSEMEILADALGQSFEFFMKDADAMKVPIDPREQIACFAGTLKDEDLDTAHKLVELFQFYDSLTSFDL